MGQYKNIFLVGSETEFFGRQVPKHTPILNTSTNKLYKSIDILGGKDTIASKISSLEEVGSGGSSAWNKYHVPYISIPTTYANFNGLGTPNSFIIPNGYAGKTIEVIRLLRIDIKDFENYRIYGKAFTSPIWTPNASHAINFGNFRMQGMGTYYIGCPSIFLQNPNEYDMYLSIEMHLELAYVMRNDSMATVNKDTQIEISGEIRIRESK